VGINEEGVIEINYSFKKTRRILSETASGKITSKNLGNFIQLRIAGNDHPLPL
jgi:hypothetical protein